jgi:hypothetical protein
MEDTDRILISDKGQRGKDARATHPDWVMIKNRKFNYDKNKVKRFLIDPNVYYQEINPAFTWDTSPFSEYDWDDICLNKAEPTQKHLDFLNWLVREDIEDHGE